MQKNNLTVTAINKNVRSSPRKLALVLKLYKRQKGRFSFERFRVY